MVLYAYGKHKPMKRPVADRFWEKVDKGQDCWLWTAGVSTPSGYGQFYPARGRAIHAHRWAYEQEYGPIPMGLQIDHECHNESGCLGGITCIHHRCVRPSHLRAVSSRVNILAGQSPTAKNARKTHCKHGHPFTGENLYRRERERYCRTCRASRYQSFIAEHGGARVYRASLRA